MTVFVESNQFNQMISYQPYVTTRQEKKKVKYSLLDRIIEGLGDKWYRLKEGTRQAYDMICFFSAELGFFYASDEYLAERHEISDRTVRNKLKELVELGQAVKVHRRSSKCNGRGKPIYLLVNHPYFNYWVELLGIELEDFHTDFQTENAESPTESKEEGMKKVPTYILPSLKQENNIYKASTEFIPNEIKNDLDFQNIVTMYALNMYDKVKNGFNIKFLSSLVNKDVKHKIRLALYDENTRQKKVKKQREEENSRVAIELGVKKEKELPFYNWLEQ